MNTRRPILVALLLLLGSLSALAAAEPRLNVLFIVSDDHSYPHVGCYGNPGLKTPHLDKFAAQGMRFERAYVTAPQCVPSRASFLTGRSPVGMGMTRFSAPLPRHIKTSAEALREAGWFTGVAGRTYHLDGARTSPESRDVLDRYKLATFKDRLDFVKTAGGNEVSLEQFTEFLDLKPKDQPFFLQLGSSDPHRPLTTAGPVKHDPATIVLPAHFPDTPLVREDFARYYDEIAHFDVFFGQVMAELERRGLGGNTLVVFIGDNGCSQFRGKGTLYEFGVRVPLLVRWPGRVQADSRSDELVSGEDLAPTFLEAAGVPIPREMTGRSFFKLLTGAPHEGRTHVFAERGSHGSALPGNAAGFDLARVVITKSHKLIYHALGLQPYLPVDFGGDRFWKELVEMNAGGKLDPKFAQLYFKPTRPLFEVYDLAVDPGEFNNLAGKAEMAGIEKELKAALNEWMILENDYLPLPINPEPRNKNGNKNGEGGNKGGRKKAKPE